MDFRTLLILLLIALLLFGASKLPTLARSLGKSARILKTEAKGLVDEENGERKEGREAAEDGQAPGAQPAQEAQGAQAQQERQYPELPAGQRIVNEKGEPVRRYED
ncbi:twin-arginine translocase TatA/TatE family subunit [Nocardiopsis suaedae]|uniref:Sec-independent protein translocase protein TatA n=1 Tax=Nocardiopsis suaedae TaxID=3018444 RepID=A0ABT4TUQ4_9ACTN|nr:twin-arginine translocase TatA/TatE family subunit [Nocardiopsis suaedae]MDA2808434.1 twin-arginine translocase TatA/TatE family subunit [Nocardiopsis suaedae]